MGKKIGAYTPFYPTTVGTKSHDITLKQLPAYSMSNKPEITTKACNKLISFTYRKLLIFLFLVIYIDSPGPGAYPKDDVKKSNLIPKSLYPKDHAFKYSLGARGYFSTLPTLIGQRTNICLFSGRNFQDMEIRVRQHIR